MFVAVAVKLAVKESIAVVSWNLAVSLPSYRGGEQASQLGLLKPASVPAQLCWLGQPAAKVRFRRAPLCHRNAPRLRSGLAGALGRLECTLCVGGIGGAAAPAHRRACAMDPLGTVLQGPFEHPRAACRLAEQAP